jgi:lipid-binding SYLF domain-containing protein
MRRLILLAALGLAACTTTPTPSEPQVLVDRSALTVQELLGEGNDRLEAASLLRRARGALICPRTFRAGFFVGGEGGGCVLLGRDAAGSWSSPAFYQVGSGSFGFQAGIQDSQTLLLLMNDRALNALMDSQFKVGADASLAIANVGGSVEAGATTALGADILAFSRSRGLFAGLALEGSVLTAQSEWNRAYYGREVSPRDIVVAMNAHNPGADPLRAALLRFGQGAGQGSRGAGAARPASEIEPIASPPSGGAVIPAAPTRAGRATGAVGRQALPPPPR